MRNHERPSADPFSLMRVDVSFDLEAQHADALEAALGQYVEHPEVETEILTSSYQNGQFELQLCYFSTDGSYRNELAWLHKVVQTVVVPAPVFTVQIHRD